MKPDHRALIAQSALFCCSLLAGYILVEVGYRAFTYASFYEQMRFAAGRAFIAGKNSIFDEHTGYRYEPNLVDPNFRTNSHGLIAREEFPVEKPADEYRIGVIGASFTANVDSTIRWTDVVEDALNASTVWRVSVGGRRTRVINFGLDGIGFSQYGAVAERIALPFDLDLLFVNVTTNDFVRRPYYRGPLSAMSEAQLSAHITQHIMPRVNWFRFNPEVLAVVTGGRLGLKPHIEMNDLRLRTRFFGTTSEAVEASSASMTTILRLFPETIFLLDHDFIELYENNNSRERAALLGVSARFPSAKWVDVLKDQKIAIPVGPELMAWFLPDGHKNDLGVTIYGKAVASFLIARVGSRGEVD
ncbi:MAG: SGNH/GDSL hydrolase family protein [Pseudolabrys sp.]